MLNALLRIALAGMIAVGIVAYVTDGDFDAVGAAFAKAWNSSAERKEERIAAKNNAPDAEDAQIDAPISVVTERSVAQPMPSELKMTGATEASRVVEVKAETSGMLAETTVKGRRVNQGDVLCRLKVGDRGARREAAVARFRQAQIEQEAQERLSARGFAAANNATSAQTSADVIRAEIKQLDVEIRRLEIRAPFAGVIENDPAQVGAILQTGSTCATIVDPDPIKVVGFAPEFRVGEVEIGTVGSARLATGQTVEGRVDFIAQTADPATRTFRIELSVPNPDYALRDEVTAEITIPLGSQPAHSLPQSALTLNDDGEIGVMLVENSTARFRAVEILRDDDEGVRLGGIGDRAEVIVVGQEYVSDGTEVVTTSAADANLDGSS